MTFNFRAVALVAVLPMVASAVPKEDYAEPYRVLQQANRTLDPELAASAYAAGGKLIFEQPESPGEIFQGRAEIRQAYIRTFGHVDVSTVIDLDFRFEPPGLGSPNQSGAYRLKAKVGGRPLTLYGRFTVRLQKEKGSWRFLEDRGSAAVAADFDRLPRASLE